MTSPFAHKARAAGIVFITWLLSACGGGTDPANTAQMDGAGAAQATAATSTGEAADASQRERRASSSSAALNVEGSATELIVTAYGTLAGGVGPLMQVRVDGAVVGTTEVRATAPTGYRFSVPTLRTGSKVDVVFTNDAKINGADRNLIVVDLVAGATYAVPTAPGAVVDRGVGAAAFDGLDTLAGQGALFWNVALRLTWPAPNMPERITVRASGTLAGNVGPVMQLRVNGVTVGSTEVRASEPTDYSFAVPPLAAGTKIDVIYSNDATVNGEDRNLKVDYLISGDTFMLPTANTVVYDLGAGVAALDGANVQAGRATMAWNGALRFKWTAPNLTSRITVRASGSLAGNVGPVMQLRVDGVTVGSAEVRTADLSDYIFAIPPLRVGSKVDVVFANDAIIDGADRNLTVAYLIADTTFVKPASPAVLYDLGAGAAAFDGVNVRAGTSAMTSNGALRTDWPAPNMTATLTVRARATVAGNVGAMMQVRVDDVVVGSTEVRATEPSDYNFPAPTLLPGSKVDVVYVNDGTVNGVDRNLFVSYLISGHTSVLPNAAGVLYDRGRGAAAFDGADTLPGMGTLAWNGALRAVWPAPNMTDTVTVRASGTLAANVGPVMQVRVDGVAVGTVEVRAAELTDYAIAVPPLRPGSRIDVVFTNDAIIDGADRNLTVAYLQAGSTVVQATMPGVIYDLGTGAAAFDGANTLPGRMLLGSNGALRLTWPAPNVTSSITVRASATLAENVGAIMQLRVNGVILGSVEVRSPTGADYVFATPALLAGSKIDLVFTNDLNANGQDRNLFVQYIKAGTSTLVATGPNVVVDVGVGEAAFDGAGTAPSSGAMYSGGALRFTMPALAATAVPLAQQYAASRFLQQATFGPTTAEIARLTTLPPATWINEQMAMPPTADFVNYVQSKYNLGDDYRPHGVKYDPSWVTRRFWATAATSPDQLRKRVAFALHQIFMVSQLDSNLWIHTRAYANYLDTLNQYAFGNYRTLLEAVALSPATGIYLSHMRNRPEDPSTGRLPDENFAREVMQLYSIGLHELNIDGTPRLDARGKPIETYDNNDVMAMAKVFTGWGWAFPDSRLTDQNFRYGHPDYSVANDQRIDLQRMKAYPGQHSPAEKRLFGGKPHAVVIAANGSGPDSVRIALDTLFNHPNVGPFIGRQLIQRLVTSNPSPAYVARVAAAFNNNGQGVRGDLAAVVRAILLDSDARAPANGDFGKLREPVLRMAHWMRSFAATSASGEYILTYELNNLLQRPQHAASVFGYYRPAYVPPNTVFSASNATVPELQIVNESTAANWVNKVAAMAGNGVGWTGTVADVSSTLATQVSMSAAGNVDGLIENLNLLLFDGRMSSALRQDLLDAMTTVNGTTPASHRNRARVALFLAMSSPEYLVQR